VALAKPQPQQGGAPRGVCEGQGHAFRAQRCGEVESAVRRGVLAGADVILGVLAWLVQEPAHAARGEVQAVGDGRRRQQLLLGPSQNELSNGQREWGGQK